MLDAMSESDDDEILEIASDHQEFTFSLLKIDKELAKATAISVKKIYTKKAKSNKATCSQSGKYSGKLVKANKKYRKEDYVIFEREEELFPEVIIFAKVNGYFLRSMVRSGMNWKWPKATDKILYRNEDIKQKINIPITINRGVLEIPELAMAPFLRKIPELK